jgi:hypothetical protein
MFFFFLKKIILNNHNKSKLLCTKWLIDFFKKMDQYQKQAQKLILLKIKGYRTGYNQ